MVNNPNIRFAGFADEWVQRKLGDVGKTKSGIGFPDTQQGGTQGTPFYKVSDMNNPGNEVVMMNANNYASDSQLKENKWNPINPQNSGVVFAKVGAAIFLDRKRIVDTSFLIDNNMMSYLFDSSWNRYFGKTLFEKLRLSRFAQVGALPSFNGSDVEDIKVMIPEESEQKMIGNMFEKLDNTIALHQRKLDLLKKQKKGYLQKMFPKNGAIVPEWRFTGFVDDWEELKFKDILKTHSFRSYLAGVSENGEYEVIQQGDKPIVGYSDGEPFTDYKDVTLFGDHTVSLYKPKSPFFVATDGVKILSADNFDGDYLYTTLERYKPEPQGYKRHFTILKNQDVCFTENFEEQQKIGSFFKQLDDVIALHQRKLELLKDLKKGLSQQMFA